MKKFLFVLFFMLFMGSVSALEEPISYVKLDGIYYNQNVNGDFKSNYVTMFKFGERIAYCIEPGVDINTKVYDTGDWSLTDFSEEDRLLIEKIGYYGYEYPGHNTDRYYIATQELIWKAVMPSIDVSFTTGKNMTGEIIDISFEKNEIMKLVNTHLLPSFSTSLVKGYTGSQIVLEDTNGVLSDFDMSDSLYHDIILEDNKLIIDLNGDLVPLEKITFTRKYYDNEPLVIYTKGSSQKMAALRFSSSEETYIEIENEEEIISVPNTASFNPFLILFMIMTSFGVCLYVKNS